MTQGDVAHPLASDPQCDASIEAKGAAEADKIVAMLNKVAARANSDEEPHCLNYIPGRSRDDPNTIVVFGESTRPCTGQTPKLH